MVSMAPNGAMPNTMSYFGGNPGYGYSKPTTPIKPTQTLTPEQIAMLSTNGGPFKLELTQEEILRGICFHRDAAGDHTLIDNGDGTITCSICGETMPLTPFTKDEVHASVKNICDVLQWIKLLYINMPAQTAQEFFQIIPMLKKAEKLFEIASNVFKSQENGQGLLTPNAGINPFAILAGIMNPGYMGAAPGWGAYAMPGAVPGAMGAVAPGATAPAAGVNPAAGAGAWGAAAGNPAWGGSNGFGFFGMPGAAPAGTVPGANAGYAYTPGMTTPPAPATPDGLVIIGYDDKGNPIYGKPGTTLTPGAAPAGPQVGGAPQAQTSTVNPDGSTTVNTQFHP